MKARTPKPRSPEAIAQELGPKVLAEFGQQTGEINYVHRAPKKRQEIWRKAGVVPGRRHRGGGADARTHMGVDQDYHNLIKQAPAAPWRTAGVRLHDLHRPAGHHVRLPHSHLGEINLGVLKEDHVNVVMHGHEPLLPEMLFVASQDRRSSRRPRARAPRASNWRHVLFGQRILMRHGVRWRATTCTRNWP